MSDLNVTPSRPSGASQDTAALAARPKSGQAKPGQETPRARGTDPLSLKSAPLGRTAVDTVSIGEAATAPSSTSTLSADASAAVDQSPDQTAADEAAATALSVGLRQSLATSGLSASARQNQAVLSLLR